MKIFKTRRTFRKEFRRQLRLAIVAAIGFTVAFAWRNAIYNASLNIVEQITQSTKFILTELLTALFITTIAILILLTTSKLLRER